MSDEKIAEIRARHEEGSRAGADADRAYLLAEVERLTRERDEARAEVENLYDQVHRWVDDRAKAQARADRLREQNYELQRERDEARAEVERLRAALQEATLAAHGCAQCRDEIGRICREALEAKP